MLDDEGSGIEVSVLELPQQRREGGGDEEDFPLAGRYEAVGGRYGEGFWHGEPAVAA